MYINGKWYTETEAQAYVGELQKQISRRDKFISGIRSYYKSTESWDELFEEDYNNFAANINVPAKSETDRNVGAKKAEQTIVQPIVYCKDCKYRKDHHYEIEGEPPYIKHSCKFSKYSMPDYGFCSCGKNKEEETT